MTTVPAATRVLIGTLRNALDFMTPDSLADQVGDAQLRHDAYARFASLRAALDIYDQELRQDQLRGEIPREIEPPPPAASVIPEFYMTKLEYFAAQAMVGLLACPSSGGYSTPDTRAYTAFDQARAMCEQSKKWREP